MHFAVESRSGAVNGVLLEGPSLENDGSTEGPKVLDVFFSGGLEFFLFREVLDGILRCFIFLWGC